MNKFSRLLKKAVDVLTSNSSIEVDQLETPPKSVSPGHFSHGYSPYGGVKSEPYIGVPAPLVPSEDPWFPLPIKTEQTIIKETEMKVREAEEKKNQPVSKEPDNIHELLYNKATKNQSTTVQLDPPGGSENFQSGPGGWSSGNGMNQFR